MRVWPWPHWVLPGPAELWFAQWPRGLRGPRDHTHLSDRLTGHRTHTRVVLVVQRMHTACAHLSAEVLGSEVAVS